MGYPVFASGDVLNASDMNSVGLWLVTRQFISAGAASTTVTGAFSADYENYRIVVSGVSASVGGQSIRFQLNNSTGNTYQIGGLFGSYGSATLNGYGPAATNLWTDLMALDTVTQGATIDLFQPFLAQRTTVTCNSVRTGASANGWYMMTGMDTAAVSNTGFTISPVTGTFNGGTIRVYGYRN